MFYFCFVCFFKWVNVLSKLQNWAISCADTLLHAVFMSKNVALCHYSAFFKLMLPHVV